VSDATIRIWTQLPTATINSNIYGHFAEHLGRCIYEGIWVGEKSKIPNEGGLRLDVLAGLKQLRAPVVRWPGGCFADAYHWRDGIGPQDKRPETVNIWWKQSEPNTFGTDEFMRFCRAVGCEPYICLNVGSGSPQEAVEWLEYCNFGGDSTLTRMRAKNGSREPYAVKYWGVGNENWGCGGRFTAVDYAKEYMRFATYLRALDSSIELVACGTNPCTPNVALARWNHDFCHEMVYADLIDHLSPPHGEDRNGRRVLETRRHGLTEAGDGNLHVAVAPRNDANAAIRKYALRSLRLCAFALKPLPP